MQSTVLKRILAICFASVVAYLVYYNLDDNFGGGVRETQFVNELYRDDVRDVLFALCPVVFAQFAVKPQSYYRVSELPPAAQTILSRWQNRISPEQWEFTAVSVYDQDSYSVMTVHVLDRRLDRLYRVYVAERENFFDEQLRSRPLASGSRESIHFAPNEYYKVSPKIYLSREMMR